MTDRSNRHLKFGVQDRSRMQRLEQAKVELSSWKPVEERPVRGVHPAINIYHPATRILLGPGWIADARANTNDPIHSWILDPDFLQQNLQNHCEE